MRKLFLLSILLSVTAAYARQISPQEAASVASEFMNARSVATRTALSPVRVTDRTEEKDAQPYYVFNSNIGNGFVIVSGDDRYSKILGYSDHGTFDFKNMPPQLKTMLEQFANNSDKHSTWTGTHPSWNTFGFSTRADEGVLLTTANWGQYAPYNAETPMFDDQHAPTGCVATAMAIVMKYHQWPDTYNWDAMPIEIEQDGETAPAPNPELARLMKDAGNAVNMSYSPFESAAHMNYVGHNFTGVFKYSPDCQYITSANFKKEKWLELIKENIDNGNPIIYQGTNEGMDQNHAFVLDGYNGDSYHINWGWDGFYNGYYSLESLTPNEFQDFSCNNGMVINIVPDKSGKSYSPCYTDWGYFYGGPGQGEAMNLSVENIQKGEPFHVVNSLITLKEGFIGLVGMALVDKDDNIKEVLKTVHYSTWYDVDQKYQDMGLTISFPNLVTSVDVEPTDRIQFVTKSDDENEYKLVCGTLEWPSYVMAANNTPRYHTLTFHIGPKVTCDYQNYEWGGGYGTLTEGDYEFNIFSGSDVYCIFRPEDPDGDNVVSVTMGGVAFYGDEEKQTGKEIHFHPGIYADAVFTATFVEFKDEDITLTEAGTLKDKINKEEANGIRNLTVKGKMNALDFWFIRDNCPSIKSLNIKDVDIEEVTATDEKFSGMPYLQPERYLPQMALWALQNLESIVLPDNLIGICDDALCALNLSSISIPAGVESIGLNAFFSNQNLQVVELLNPNPVWIKDCVFTSTLCPDRGYLYVPEGSLQKYQEAEIWKDFKVIREGRMPAVLSFDTTYEGLKYTCEMDNATVTGYEGEPKDVVIPDAIVVDGKEYPVTIIDNRSFADCQTIETVNIGKNIDLINDEAFVNCVNLKSVKLGPNVEIIRDAAFNNCPQLEECDLPAGLKFIGSRVFWSTGLKKVFIPKTVAPIPNYYQGSFSDMPFLEAFEVEEGNAYFRATDGVLYRNCETGLTLECVPGLKAGKLILPEDCHTVWGQSIVGATQIDEIVFNENLKVIESFSMRIFDGLKSITLPKNAFIGDYAFYSASLETVIFTGNLSQAQNMFTGCDNLKNIVIASSDEMVNLNGIFDSPKEEINIFISSPEKNFAYSDKYNLFVAGALANNFKNDEAAEVKEMWNYGIDREHKLIIITPQIEGLAIERVLVNGEEVENISLSRAADAQDFVYPVDDLDNLNVTIEYTLFGSQKMSSEYTSEFNAEVPHTPTSVGEILTDDATVCNLYDLNGQLILKNGSKADLDKLSSGIYILRQGNRSRKIVIKK